MTPEDDDGCMVMELTKEGCLERIERISRECLGVSGEIAREMLLAGELDGTPAKAMLESLVWILGDGQ